MKKLLVLFVLFASLLGCTGVKTTSQGLDNEAFISIVGDPDLYINGVVVTIDNKEFVAKVSKDFTTKPTGEVYSITPGKHLVKVMYNGNLLYQKQIFISNQETRKIKL